MEKRGSDGFQAFPSRVSSSTIGRRVGTLAGRPFRIYFAAVVLPTVVILGLGIATYGGSTMHSRRFD